ncbi:hypothetical protein [Polaribacter filamentus]|nr:hypothetical protein [Polaribacter filamentus]
MILSWQLCPWQILWLLKKDRYAANGLDLNRDQAKLMRQKV